MAENGSRFLEHTRRQFLEDLVESFGERSDGFGAELKVLLFELWVRARSRPPFPPDPVEPSDEMKQQEFEGRMATALAHAAALENAELQREFVRAVQRSVAVGEGITRNDRAEHLSLHLDPTRNAMDQHEFAKQLDATFKIDGPGIGRDYDPGIGEIKLWLQLDKLPAFESTIPEFDPLMHPTGDDDQKRLEKRLMHLGVGGAPPNWLPVFQQENTGLRAGLDIPGGTQYLPRPVETFLVYDETSMNWMFPSPRPTYTYDDCHHVRLWVDGVEQMNSSCIWNGTHDGHGRQVLEWVNIPGTTNMSSVRAVYDAVQKEYGL